MAEVAHAWQYEFLVNQPLEVRCDKRSAHPVSALCSLRDQATNLCILHLAWLFNPLDAVSHFLNRINQRADVAGYIVKNMHSRHIYTIEEQ